MARDAHFFQVVTYFTNGDYHSSQVNCTNSIEAVKAALSLPGVVERVTNGRTIADIKVTQTVLRG